MFKFSSFLCSWVQMYLWYLERQVISKKSRKNIISLRSWLRFLKILRFKCIESFDEHMWELSVRQSISRIALEATQHDCTASLSVTWRHLVLQVCFGQRKKGKSRNLFHLLLLKSLNRWGSDQSETCFAFFAPFSWLYKNWPENLRRYAPTKENPVEVELISINQHQSVSVSNSQHRSACQSASINICNWLCNFMYRHKCSKFLRSVRRL